MAERLTELPGCLTVDDLARVRLQGLAGRVKLGSKFSGRKPLALLIDDSPGLQELDLSDCPGGMRIEFAPGCHPSRVILPDGDCLLHIRLQEHWPVMRFKGIASRVLVEIHAGGLLDEVHGLYGLGAIEGLALTEGILTKRIPGIQHYLRIDQSTRGLQLKRIQGRVDPRDILWQLRRPARAGSHLSATLLAADDDFLQRLAFGGNDEVVEWLREQSSSQKDRQSQAARFPNLEVIEALIVRLQRGVCLKVIWALRCGWQMGVAQTPDFMDLDQANSSANPRMSVGGRLGRRGTEVNIDDLRLFCLCADSGLTRRHIQSLGRLYSPTDMIQLARVIAEQDPAGSLRERLAQQLAAALLNLQDILLRGDTNDDAGSGFVWHLLSRSRENGLQELVVRSCAIGHPDCLKTALDLGTRFLPTVKRISTGIELVEHGVFEGRLMIASALGEKRAIQGELRARAMACLLGCSEDDQPADRDSDTRTRASA
jgi:hypothetical protein